MFFTKIAKDEIANSFSSEIEKLEKDSEKIGDVKADISRYLEKAAEYLANAGFKAEAEIISKLANDPATKGITSDKMIVNLEEHGTVLSLPTDKATDILDEMKGKDHGWAADDGAIVNSPDYQYKKQRYLEHASNKRDDPEAKLMDPQTGERRK
jgi:hypothetical protein